MWNFQTDTKTENERYLEEQLEQERQWREDERLQKQQEHERRQQEIKEQREWNLRSAEDWLEGLQNQSYLCWREHNLDDDEDSFFKDMAEACEFALKIWSEESEKVTTKIAKLEAKIAKLRESVRYAVGNRLNNHERKNQQGWQSVVTTLQEDADPEGWLKW